VSAGEGRPETEATVEYVLEGRLIVGREGLIGWTGRECTWYLASMVSVAELLGDGQ
jgi:hypothetical protein